MNIKKINCRSAKEILEILSPWHDEWCNCGSLTYSNWIFRGQASSEWSLIPKAFRQGELEKYIGIRNKFNNVEKEIYALKEFISAANYQGIQLPEDNIKIRDRLEIKPIEPQNVAVYIGDVESKPYCQMPSNWPGDDIISLLALAQHQGLPTRLLDWTSMGHIAAYFAASDAILLNNDIKKNGKIVIWALNKKIVEKIKEINIKEIPSGLNPNLARQKGIFTFIRGLDNLKLVALDSLISDHFGGKNKCNCFLKKITLPVSKAKLLLYFLSQEGINASAMFGDLTGGALRLVKERAQIVIRGGSEHLL
jgi:hypothetical protein